jgi:hypothetical protein
MGLHFTTKPKWSCYFDLHTLPPQGDIRPSQSSSASCHQTHPLTLTFSNLSSFCLEWCRTLGRHRQGQNTPTPDPWPLPPTGTRDRQRSPPSPTRLPAETGPGNPTKATMLPAKTIATGGLLAGHGHRATLLRIMTMEFFGITTNSIISLTQMHLPCHRQENGMASR